MKYKYYLRDTTSPRKLKKLYKGWQRIHPAYLYCWRCSGIHSAGMLFWQRTEILPTCPHCLWWRWIHPACPHWSKCGLIHKARTYSKREKGIHPRHIYTASSGEGYTMQIHTGYSGKEYISRLHSWCWKGKHPHVHTVDCRQGYTLSSILLTVKGDTPLHLHCWQWPEI